MVTFSTADLGKRKRANQTKAKDYPCCYAVSSRRFSVERLIKICIQMDLEKFVEIQSFSQPLQEHSRGGSSLVI